MSNPSDAVEPPLTPQALLRIGDILKCKSVRNLFADLVTGLTSILGVDIAFIGRLSGTHRGTVDTVAVGRNGAIADNFTYDLAGTPCERVASQSACLFERGVQALFPDDQILVEFGIEAYAGTPLHGSDDRVIGLLVVLSRRPITEPDTVRAVLQIFASRVAAELERREIVQEREAALQRTELALEGAALGLWDWNIALGEVYYSPRAMAMLGYPEEPIQGTFQTWLDLLHPDDLERTTKELAEAFDHERPAWDLQFRLRTADGGYRWILSRGRVIEFDPDDRPSRALGTHLDITERVAAQAAVEERERLYRETLNRLPVGIQECDVEGTITFASEPFERMLGYAPGTAVGRKIWETMVDRHQVEALTPYLELLARDQPAPTPYTSENLTLDGRRMHIRVDWDYRRSQDGEVRGFTCIVSDITTQVEAEREREQFEADRRRAQRLAAIGTLAGGIAHDFNNILMGIQGYTEVALDEAPATGDGRSALEEVLRAVERARDIIGRILAFGRKSDDVDEAVDLAAICAEALRLLRATIPQTIEIRQDLHEQPCWVWANPGELHQVIVNLCTNAAQSMASGGRLCVSVSDDADSARLVVEDTGCGMDEATRERIFEPYFTTRTDGHGSGLGLAVVHGIVTAAGGEIAVTSDEGRGTRITVILPRCDAPEESATAPEPTPREQVPARIVFVDDEVAIANLALILFPRLGCEVEAFTDPRSALARIEADPMSVDLLISDVTMPGLTGLELAAAVREIRPDLPVVLCTGYSDLVAADEAADLGVRELLAKPVNTRTFENLVARLCGSGSEQSPTGRAGPLAPPLRP